MSKSKSKAKAARRTVAVTPTFLPNMAGIDKASLALAASVFPTVRGQKAAILAALALCGNNAPHRKVATMVGAFHKAATAKGCPVCRESMGDEYSGACAGNDAVTRWTVSVIGARVKVAPRGSRADRVANLWAFWFMGLKAADRAAVWASTGATLRK